MGSYLPPKIISNDDLEKLIDTSSKWIVQRTGIRTRHHLNSGDDPAIMGIEAGRDALSQAGVSPNEIDLLIVATNFPDMICPGSAPFIAAGLGLDQTPFFDIKAGCSGFVYGVVVADGLIASGGFQRILLVGTEALSRVTDWSDRKTCVLFGDGAGAVLLERTGSGEGILGSLRAGGTKFPATESTVKNGDHYLKMEGAGVFRSAVPMMESSTREAIAAAGLHLSDIDWLIPHQANIRIIDSLARRLHLSKDQVIINLDRVANTSTASIPIALDEAVRAGRIKHGDLVVMTAFGAGVTYGAVLIQI